jgi:hypothetical protein
MSHPSHSLINHYNKGKSTTYIAYHGLMCCILVLLLLLVFKYCLQHAVLKHSQCLVCVQHSVKYMNTRVSYHHITDVGY